MLRLSHRLGGIAAFFLTCLAPRAVQAQQGTITATATVSAQPLSFRSVASVATGQRLHVGLAGCGTGTLTVDGRLAGGALVRVARHDIAAGSDCRLRSILLPLVHRDSAQIVHFELRLSQADAVLAPVQSAIVVSAAATRTGTSAALLY